MAHRTLGASLVKLEEDKQKQLQKLLQVGLESCLVPGSTEDVPATWCLTSADCGFKRHRSISFKLTSKLFVGGR